MTSPHPPSQPDLPETRIGDEERDRAAGLLQEHLAKGRITVEEFDERVQAALEARTQSQLDALFLDLPGAPRELAPLGWEDLPEPARPNPWWAHQGLFILMVVLTVVGRFRLWPVLLLTGIWVFAIAPHLVSAMHARQLELHRRALGGPEQGKH